jgi:hypothetical protein
MAITESDVLAIRGAIEASLGYCDYSDSEILAALLREGFDGPPAPPPPRRVSLASAAPVRRREPQPLNLRLLSACESLDEVHALIHASRAGLL